MNKFLLSLAAAMALIAPSTGFASDTPIYGVWVRDGHPTDKLEFYDCSGKLCAKGVLPMADGSPPPIVLRSANKTGPNSWKGDLFNPEDGKTYTGKITYEPPTQFTLTGCLVAFLCQSETWTRVSGPPKPKTEPKAESKVETKGDGKAEAKTPDAKESDDGGHDGHGADKAPGAAKPAAEGAKPSGPANPSASGETARTHKPAKTGEAKPAAAKPAAPKAAPAHPKPPEEEGN